MNFLQAHQLVVVCNTRGPGKLPWATGCLPTESQNARAEECKEVTHPVIIKPESTWSKCPIVRSNVSPSLAF